ncbi:MAG: hypothetical protein C7B45_00410 [Sulfobacillus acidophilus]|uniref:PRC-barrel domain-containing protein n=1 Tax=Sulfobacillus acidophilus TaxID=53633 RepID=A0A2T2WPE4_9FIRM|nr:MAG: hypothetical protein C7B45_00410 [Sulfobacillus acidophilus]
MVSGWHVAHLPVRVAGDKRVRQMVDQVLVSWPDLRILGFLLTSRPFQIPFVPVQAAFKLTGVGLEIRSFGETQLKSRRWRRDMLGLQKAYWGLPVVDLTGRFYGRLKDVLFDERTLHVTHLIVSRGVLGDLMEGAMVVRAQDVLDVARGEIKIQPSRAPFSMR